MSTSVDVLRSVFPSRAHAHGELASETRSKHNDPSIAESNSGRESSKWKRRPERAWDIATRYLDLSIWTLESARKETETPADVRTAILSLPRRGGGSSYEDDENDLVDWYMQAVRRHYTVNVKPSITSLWSKYVRYTEARYVLEETCKRLQSAQELYRLIAVNHVLNDTGIVPSHIRRSSNVTAAIPSHSRRGSQKLSPWANGQVKDLLALLHNVFLHSLPTEQFSKTLTYRMFSSAQEIFQVSDKVSSQSRQPTSSLQAQSEQFLNFLKTLQEVGLGNRIAQDAFATAMQQLIEAFVNSHWMKVDWITQKSVVNKLESWVKRGFRPFVISAVEILHPAVPYRKVIGDCVQIWVTDAIERLGAARVRHLFDFVVRWPSSTGAILDLKSYCTTPEARMYLTTTFIDQVDRRLLHPGATTTQILDVYISIIRSFTELDAKGVLLDRVARPIRKYLKTRDDTAKIIVASLLANESDDSHSMQYELSAEIAKEMKKPISGTETHHGELDWDNMNWTPDPIDADAEFKAHLEDILASLLSLFDREDFINELKTILGDHFLRNLDAKDYDMETKLLELFKHRLGDDKLQACEVMLNDVQTSKRMTETILRREKYKKTKELLAKKTSHVATRLDVQVLSSYFWPSLRDETFKVPPPVQLLYNEYARSFEELKGMRKLHWLSALGRVDVELQLEDRTIEESVPTWVASVIYAFSSDDSNTASRTAEELQEMLEMDEALVQNGILFWIGKQVLHETSPGTYSVLETLPSQDAATEAEAAATAAAAAAQAEADAAASAVKTQEDVFAENAALYEQFILGMLTNQGNLPSMRVWMMLKMVFPGGFTFGLEEVQGLLEKMVDAGQIVSQGDIYGMKK